MQRFLGSVSDFSAQACLQHSWLSLLGRCAFTADPADVASSPASDPGESANLFWELQGLRKARPKPRQSLTLITIPATDEVGVVRRSGGEQCKKSPRF